MAERDDNELTILDQARTQMRMGREIDRLTFILGQMQQGWNDVATVKARYDELKAEADAAEAREVAAAMTAEKPVADMHETAAAPIANVAGGVESGEPGPSRPVRRKRG